ncbi:DUF2252 domain-containing protein [Streptomyces sp. NPDC086023]|uniref:DUF2252 domain-containing protein n=1 Tax=Streptomyces sp. NPDC086023 TaxID=3365746 RepID=UPI0037D5FA5D
MVTKSHPTPHWPTPDERAAAGKAARARVRRADQGGHEPAPDRPDPVATLEAQAASRVPELVPIRYGRMLESPFRFYRGAAAIMAADLGRAPHTGLTTQLCGDAHALNFGLFASPERNLVFDINDFDETCPGPFEWDVKRLAAGFSVAGRDNGYDEVDRRAVVREAVRSYRERMRAFSDMRVLDIWYAHDDAEDLRALVAAEGTRTMRRRTDEALTKARSKNHLRAFAKLTRVVDGERRFVADPPLVTPLRDLLAKGGDSDPAPALRALLAEYGGTLTAERRELLGRFRLVDIARKVVGVGSVGTRCWILLMLGRDDEDPLILQAKEAGESVLAPYAGPVTQDNQGQRVVEGQRLMQAAGDIFLGWHRVTGIDGRRRDFYVRQLHDWKGGPDTDAMVPAGMRLFARVCGAALARAHARAGDPVAIAAYLGSADTFDRALADYAEAYAEQNRRDYEALAAAVADGRVTAAPDPAAARS